jgi:peptidoglycan/xylan/chitin deacetylase (PgdA/CDA1 family)
VIAKLKEEGWTFASHTWAHLNLEKKGLARVTDDTERWFNEVGSLVGPTKVLLYPYGGRPDGGDVKQTGECFRYLQSKGFRIFASVGISSYSKIKSDICAVICDRLHPDGTTLRWSRDRYLQLYDAWKIIDLKVRPDRAYDRNPGR